MRLGYWKGGYYHIKELKYFITKVTLHGREQKNLMLKQIGEDKLQKFFMDILDGMSKLFYLAPPCTRNV